MKSVRFHADLMWNMQDFMKSGGFHAWNQITQEKIHFQSTVGGGGAMSYELCETPPDFMKL